MNPAAHILPPGYLARHVTVTRSGVATDSNGSEYRCSREIPIGARLWATSDRRPAAMVTPAAVSGGYSVAAVQ